MLLSDPLTYRGILVRRARGIALDAPRRWLPSDSPDYAAHTQARLRARVKITEGGCWEWQGGKNKDGYGLSCWHRKTMAAHRVSWLAFKGSIPDRLWVLHKCDNPPCINPDHLYLGNAANNTADRIKRLRTTAGERHGQAKLTFRDVSMIRDLYKGRGRGPSYKTLADKFKVGITTIASIVKNRTWEQFLADCRKES